MTTPLEIPLPSSPPPDPSCTIAEANFEDPPPPYPSRPRRSRRTARSRNNNSHHAQFPSTESDFNDPPSSPPSHTLIAALAFPRVEVEEEDEEVSETTPFLHSSGPRGVAFQSRRARALSHASTMLSAVSTAPSLVQTTFSLFAIDPRMDEELGDEEDSLLWADGIVPDQQLHSGFFNRAAWRRYFRPLWVKANYKSLLHIAIINFFYALTAWIYLFVFTLCGTVLLMVLPLGVIFCFLDVLGARTFARGELALQIWFHHPLTYSPYPPFPIFARPRAPIALDDELNPDLRSETSFYKNTRAMFADPTSYQAIFYFLVIKPGITLILSVLAIAICPLAFVLVLPAPAFLRAIRRLGIWQANIAIEGLYFPMR